MVLNTINGTGSQVASFQRIMLELNVKRACLMLQRLIGLFLVLLTVSVPSQKTTFIFLVNGLIKNRLITECKSIRVDQLQKTLLQSVLLKPRSKRLLMKQYQMSSSRTSTLTRTSLMKTLLRVTSSTITTRLTRYLVKLCSTSLGITLLNSQTLGCHRSMTRLMLNI